MAKEYKLPYTAFEIGDKLRMVDEVKISLENDYCTKDEVNTTFEKITDIIEEVSNSVDNTNISLDYKADLVNGKVPLEQLPDNIGGNGGSLEQVQADFAQNDDTQPDYIKNRIAYSNGVKDVEVINQTYAFEFSDMDAYAISFDLSDSEINTWKNLSDISVVWDGTAYTVSKHFFQDVYFWGNPAMAGIEPTDDPFMIVLDEYSKTIMILCLTDSAPDDLDNAPTIDHSVKVFYQAEDTYTDAKYFNIDNILTVGKGDVIHGKTTYAFEMDETTGLGFISAEGKFFLPPAGKKVKVYWDNVEYLCTVASVGEDDVEILAIGSVDAFINEDLSLINEPFVIISYNTDLYYDIYSLDTNLSHEMYIVAEDEFKAKIDGEHFDVNLNFDDYPTYDSTNLLTSGAIYKALGYRDNIQVVNYVDSGSNNPISSQAVYQALGNRNSISINDSVSSHSDSPVSSKAVYEALGGRSKLIISEAVSAYSDNPVSSKAVYEALQNIDLSSKQDKVSVTTSDNGKFMRVVNGAWAAVAVPNAEDGEF